MQLYAKDELNKHEIAKQGLAEMSTLFDYLAAMGCLSIIRFDLSLARGLDYYTGVIYECTICDPELKVCEFFGVVYLSKEDWIHWRRRKI